MRQRNVFGNTLFLPKRVSDPAHPALGVYQHDVEAYTGPSPVWMVRKHGGASGKQAGALALADSGCGDGKLGPCLHLHQRQQPVQLGSNIDLAGRRADAPS